MLIFGQFSLLHGKQKVKHLSFFFEKDKKPLIDRFHLL